MTRRSPLAVALAVALRAAGVRAFEGEVRADTQAQSYQVRGPAGAPVLSLRRLTQTLTLAAVERPSHGRGVTWTLRARLRVDADFGTACEATGERCLDELNRSRAAEFAPLFARRTLDLPFAYLEGAGFFGGRADVRLGRQLVTDPLGFFLFDGARGRVRLGPVRAEVYGGLETRTGFPLSNGRYERDGLARVDRTGWDPSLAARVADRAEAWALGAALETAGDGPLFARATWRRVWGVEGVAEEKLAVSADVTLSEAWRAYAEGVWSLPQEMVASATAGVAWAGASGGAFGAEVSRWRPTFDLTSIWASFWTDPMDDARLRGELPLGRGWTLLGALQGRRYALSETASSQPLPDAWTAGGDLGLALRRGRWDASLRGHGEGGDLGARAGADLTSRVWIRWQVLRLDAGVSAWWVDDVLRPARSVASLALTVGALVRIARAVDLQLGFEDDINRIVGHRLRLAAVLTLRVPY